MREIMDRRLVLAEAKLTPLQRQVLSLVGEGKTDKQIALALKIDETTTRAQIRSILRILGVHTERPKSVDSRDCRRCMPFPPTHVDELEAHETPSVAPEHPAHEKEPRQVH
jgi:DNA-binding CsgD family transcriptional regulator